MPLGLFESAGVAALYDENGTAGEVDDFDAPRNAPAKNPVAHLDKIYFHSHLGLLEVAAMGSATISHDSVGGSGSPSGVIEANKGFTLAAHSDDHLLLEHNLDYEPFFLVVWDDGALIPGMPVQTDAAGGARYVTAYATATQIRLAETADVAFAALSSVSRSYSVIVFRDFEPVANPTAPVFNFEKANGVLQFGRERVRFDRRYLQIAPGGSPFGLRGGRTADTDNGTFRVVRADGTPYDALPPDFRTHWIKFHNYSWMPNYPLGAPMNYAGSFVAPAVIEVQAP